MSIYSKALQSTIGPSNYFKDHANREDYINYSIFLPYINNEKELPKYNQYKRRFESLNFFTMYKFESDPIIYPNESTWFGEKNAEGKIIKMEETIIYK